MILEIADTPNFGETQASILNVLNSISRGLISRKMRPAVIYTSSLKALETATLATRRLDLILCAINRVLQNMLLQEFRMDQGTLWHFIKRYHL
jgi:hypothetical protein